MISPNPFLGGDHSISKQAKYSNKGELILRLVDFSTEERRPGTVLLRFRQQLERVVRRPRRPAENANDHVRIVRDEFFHRLGAVIDDLQKDGATSFGHPCQRPRDHVVDKGRLIRDDPRDVRIEDF